jgi:hypothetical protein
MALSKDECVEVILLCRGLQVAEMFIHNSLQLPIPVEVCSVTRLQEWIVTTCSEVIPQTIQPFCWTGENVGVLCWAYFITAVSEFQYCQWFKTYETPYAITVELLMHFIDMLYNYNPELFLSHWSMADHVQINCCNKSKRKGEVPGLNQAPCHQQLSLSLNSTPWRHMGSGDSAPRILNLGTRLGLPSRPDRFSFWVRAPDTHWIRGWVGPRAGLEAVTKIVWIHCRKSCCYTSQNAETRDVRTK